MSIEPEEIIDQGLKPNPLDAPLPDGIFSAEPPFELSPREELIELSKIPPVESPQIDRTLAPRTFRGMTNARHGVHAPLAAGPDYECADCRDLYERLRKKFKEIGYDF